MQELGLGVCWETPVVSTCKKSCRHQPPEFILKKTIPACPKRLIRVYTAYCEDLFLVSGD